MSAALDTLPGVREAAEAMAREFYAAVVAQRPEGDTRPFDALPVDWQHAEIAAHLALLCDLTRDASVDWWARWLAERVGMTVGATAPRWSLRGSPVASCYPSWILGDYDDEHVAFSETNPASVYRKEWVDVPGIAALTDPRAALRLACLHIGSPS